MRLKVKFGNLGKEVEMAHLQNGFFVVCLLLYVLLAFVRFKIAFFNLMAKMGNPFGLGSPTLYVILFYG